MNQRWPHPSSRLSSGKKRYLPVAVGLLLTGCVADLVTTPDASQLDPITFEAISAGEEFTCGLSGGALWCWGDNSTGQLGDGTTDGRLAATRVVASGTFTAVTTGSMHACALDATGAAYCWGSNLVGQLGSTGAPASCDLIDYLGGPVPCATAPQLVPGGITFKSIDAGPFLTCAVTVQDHTYCWGRVGQYAYDTAGTKLGLRLVDSSLALQQVTTGSVNACGLDAAGAAYCWGSMGPGLGAGTSGVFPPECTNPGTEFQCMPVAVAGGLTFRQLDAGFSHVCGIATTGGVYCWGSSSQNATLGSAINSVDQPALMDFVPPAPPSLSASWFTCVLADSGLASCWGSDQDQGELTPVPGDVTFSSLSVGARHACGIAPAGEGYCWGNNEWGALGIGTRGSRLEPSRVGAAR